MVINLCSFSIRVEFSGKSRGDFGGFWRGTGEALGGNLERVRRGIGRGQGVEKGVGSVVYRF